MRKYFTFSTSNLAACYAAIVERNENMVDLTVYTELQYAIEKQADIRWQYDVARLLFLIEHPDYIWLDADTEIIKPVDFENPKPVFYYNLNNDNYDIPIIIGNSDAGFFKTLCDETIHGTVGIHSAWLNSHRDLVDPVPEGYFYHYGYHNQLRKTNV